MSQTENNDILHTQPTHQTQNTSNVSRNLLNIVLVFLESAITLVLRFDPTLRQLAYPLASQNKVVCFRSYLPHVQFYATFAYKGVLLDDELPPNKKTPDITVNAYSFQLLGLLKNHNPHDVDKLQIRGANEDVAELKAFLTQLGIGGVIQNILGKIKDKTEKPTPEEKAEKQENYKLKIAEQAKQIDELTLNNHRLNTALAELQGKQKTTMTALIAIAVVALVAIIMNFV